MKFEEMVAISGMSGVFKLIANRPNGLIVEDIDTGKKKLAPSRKHQFTPLASIGIYTGFDDTTELAVVFRTMRDQLATNAPVNTSSSSAELSGYFEKILPEYDREKVFSSDIKKVIKWFNYLNERDLIPEEEEKTEEVEEKDGEKSETVKADKSESSAKPKADAKKKKSAKTKKAAKKED